MSKYTLNTLCDIDINFCIPSICFMEGDLGSGKTTLTQYILRSKLWINQDITSPTYTYYNKYITSEGIEIYHFDLYRISNYDEFIAIGGEEILDNNSGIIFIEWPDILKKHYTPNVHIYIEKPSSYSFWEEEREIIVTYL